MELTDRENTGLLVVDMQEKLMQVMGRKQRVIDNITRLLHLSNQYHLPITLTEHYRKWLGPTLPVIAEALPSYDSDMY